jgi:hypothetical protein
MPFLRKLQNLLYRISLDENGHIGTCMSFVCPGYTWQEFHHPLFWLSLGFSLASEPLEQKQNTFVFALRSANMN